MKHGITIHYGAGINTVAVNGPHACMVFDLNKMDKKQINELRRELTKAWKEVRQ